MKTIIILNGKKFLSKYLHLREDGGKVIHYSEISEYPLSLANEQFKIFPFMAFVYLIRLRARFIYTSTNCRVGKMTCSWKLFHIFWNFLLNLRKEMSYFNINTFNCAGVFICTCLHMLKVIVWNSWYQTWLFIKLGNCLFLCQ